MASFQELATYSSIRNWRLTGRDAIVKVVSTQDADVTIRRQAAAGYVTQAKFLAGKNAFQIERDLGLQPESLRKGAFVLYFLRLPILSEVDQRFTTDFPDGGVWSARQQANFYEARDAYRNSNDTIVKSYPPGSGAVLQWKLRSYVPISGRALQVTTSTTFYPL